MGLLFINTGRIHQVARCILDGAASGSYHLPGPDFGLNLLVAPMAGHSPRMYNVLVELLLAPLLVLFSRLAVPLADRVVRQVRQWKKESDATEQ